jgi:hypothetical protein
LDPTAPQWQPFVAGLVCFLGALNHGAVYMMFILIPMFGPMLTSSTMLIGLMMMPATIGTVTGE